ncbi:MAG: glycosyl transferase [Muribaculaceae bacterium]|nr:glycosyl transferase [Muribaculaceae bacterium]
MIPKTIHYCWFGRKPLPDLALKCIQSWQQHCPEWKIMQWNEDNFDVNSIPYTRQAYEAGRYAFVSDYARFVIIHKYGGVYLDTDVELIASIDDIIEKGPFMGCENAMADGSTHIDVAPGLGFGAQAGHRIVKELMDSYQSDMFDKGGKQDLTTVVARTTGILRRHGLKDIDGIQTLTDGLIIYPKEYFAPKDRDTKQLTITPRSRSIHHYDGSWLTPEEQYVIHAANTWTWMPLKMRYVISRFIATTSHQGIGKALSETLRWVKERT